MFRPGRSFERTAAMGYFTTLTILCFSVVCCFGQGTDTSKCPAAVKSNSNSTLYVFGGSCLEYVPRKTSWKDAKADCVSRQGRLIEIRDAAMQYFTYTTFKAQSGVGDGIWIGIDDIAVQGTWVYSSTGDAITYSNWAVGQPACFMKGQFAKYCIEDCGLMDLEEFGQWNDQYCQYFVYSYVCEYVLPV